jgi:predicted MFS family arabinose efflux permease
MDSRVFWLAVAAFVGAIEGGMVTGLLPLIGADFAVSAGQAGLLALCYSLAYAIGPTLLAVLLGGVGRRRILAGAEFSLALCMLAMALMPYFEGLLVIRTLLAIAAGTFTGTAMATAAQIAPPGQRGRYMQVISLGQAIAALAGIPLAAWIAANVGWRADYFALALMAGLASLALYTQLPRGMMGDNQTMMERVRVAKNPGMGSALFSTFLIMLGSGPLGVFIGAYMADLKVGYEMLPLVLLALGIGAVACGTIAGKLADRYGAVRVGTLSGVAILLVLVAYAGLPYLGDLVLPALLLISVVHGFVGRTYFVAVSSHMAHLAPTAVPVGISLNMATSQIGVALAAAVGGFVVDGFGALVLPVMGAPFIAVAVWVWSRLPEEKRYTGV